MKAVLLCIFLIASYAGSQRNFTIDHENNCFLKDGEPFRFVSGSLHYFRVPQQYWRQRMEFMRSAGLNVMQTYVEWSSHQPEPGQYHFQGDLDLIQFLQTAGEVGLLVILRPGPYICAERDMGGLPYWLMRNNSGIQLRTMDSNYIAPVDLWMKYLLNLVEPLLYKNGGPIIMVQIENEYGQLGICDKTYMAHLRDLSRGSLGPDVILFRTNIPLGMFYECDMTDGVMIAGDLGPDTDVEMVLNTMRQFDKTGPMVVAEYYSGWMDHWGMPHSKINVNAICKTLEDLLKANVSVNFYMFHGGTNFGFGNGANEEFLPQPTSYDYGAPMSEAGDPTTLYLRIRDIVGRYLPLPPGPVPRPSLKLSLTQPLDLVFSGSLVHNLDALGHPEVSTYPKPFEELNISHGFVIYSSVVHFITQDPSLLTVPLVRDRAYVLVEKQFVGVLDRMQKIYSIPILIRKDQTLTLVVENQGRINFGKGVDRKVGIYVTKINNVYINRAGGGS